MDLNLIREDFDGSAFAIHMEKEDPVTTQGSYSMKVYQPRIEVTWSTTSQLREAIELVIQEAW